MKQVATKSIEVSEFYLSTVDYIIKEAMFRNRDDPKTIIEETDLFRFLLLQKFVIISPDASQAVQFKWATKKKSSL